MRDGGPPVRVKWLIAAGCLLSVLLAYEGMRSIWEVSEYSVPSWELEKAFWYRDSVAIIVALALTAIVIAPLRGSRWLRGATLLPLVHLGAIVLAGTLWTTLSASMSSWCCTIQKPPVPSIAILALLGAAPLVAGFWIKRRHGEWASAGVMASLAFLLLVALWLPIVCWGWRDVGLGAVTRENFGGFWWRIETTAEDVGLLLPTVVLPPLAAALAYTALAFRKASLIARYRKSISAFAKVLAVVAVIAALTMSDRNAVLFLGYTYLILIAILVATVSLVVLVASSWIASRLAHRRMRHLVPLHGRIAADSVNAASFVVTSWLRGPRLAADSFVVSTERGDLSVSGALVLAPVPGATATLELGQEAPVLAPGDKVVVGLEAAAGDGGPFRANELGHAAMVATPDAARYSFAEVALIAWRPAVAYLAILVVTALPVLALMIA